MLDLTLSIDATEAGLSPIEAQLVHAAIVTFFESCKPHEPSACRRVRRTIFGPDEDDIVSTCQRKVEDFARTEFPLVHPHMRFGWARWRYCG